MTIVIKIRDDFPHEIHDDFVSDLHKTIVSGGIFSNATNKFCNGGDK